MSTPAPRPTPSPTSGPGAAGGARAGGADAARAGGAGGARAGGGGGGAAPGSRSGSRELAAVMGLCAVGGGLVLGAAGQSWVHVAAQRRSPLADVTLDVSGRSLAPLIAGLGVVGLAGVVGLLATRRWGRLVVAALVALSGLVIAVDALTRLAAPSPAAAQQLLTDADRGAGLAADPVISATASPGWPLVAAAGGLLLALGGLVALVRSRSWPTMSARYENPAARARRPRTDAAVWDALTRGDDPTSEPAPPGRAGTGRRAAADPVADGPAVGPADGPADGPG